MRLAPVRTNGLFFRLLFLCLSIAMRNRLPLLVFVLLGIVWGSNFVFIKWAARAITPGQIMLLRVLAAFFPLLACALLQRALRRSHVRHALHFLVMALLTSAGYFFFIEGTARLPSSIAGLLSGAIPLFTFVCTWICARDERVTALKTAGMACGCVGILLITRPWAQHSGIDRAGVACIMAGSLCVGLSFVYTRRYISPLNIGAIALATYQMGLASALFALVTRVDGITRVFDDTRAWLALVLGSGVLGTGVAYIGYYYIVDRLGALTASGVNYVPPVVALVIGVLAGEAIDPLGYAAAGLILLGVALLQWRGRRAGAPSAQQRVR
jgi:drug/metabolite transporter (DMT)-like permease